MSENNRSTQPARIMKNEIKNLVFPGSVQPSNKKRKVLSVGEILPGVFDDMGHSNIHEQVQLEKIWADIVGEDPKGVLLNGFRDGTVFITVDSSARLYHWKLRRGTVLKRFQERRPDVKNIGFKIGNVT